MLASDSVQVDRTMELLDKLVQSVRSRSSNPPFECRTCEALYMVEYHICPECGGFSVERRV